MLQVLSSSRKFESRLRFMLRCYRKRPIYSGLSALVVFGPERDAFVEEEKGLLLNLAQAASYHVDAMSSAGAKRDSSFKPDLLIKILMADHERVLNSEVSAEILNNASIERKKLVRRSILNEIPLL